MKKIIIMGLLSISSAQITGLAEHWEMYALNASSGYNQRQDRFRLNIKAKGKRFVFYYSGELVQETVSKPNLYWLNRELYVEASFSVLDLRAGQQKIEWGLINGWFLTDRINPRDMRYHLMRPLDDIRVGIPLLLAKTQFLGFDIEGVWNPEYQYDTVVNESPWTPPDNRWIFNTHTLFLKKDKYIRDKKNELGLRLTNSIWNIQYRLMWYDGFQNEPVIDYSPIHWTVNPNPPEGGEGEVQPIIDTQRQRMFGFDAELPVGSFTLQTEFGLETPFWYNTQAVFEQDNESIAYRFEKAESLRKLQMVGIKYEGLFGIIIQGQWINKYILDYQYSTTYPAKEDYGIYSMSGDIPGLNAGLSYWTIIDLRRQSGLSKMELYYWYSTKIMGVAGIHNVWGKEGHWIGEFSANDYYFIKGAYVF